MGLLEGAWDRDAGLRHILLGGIGRWDGKGAGCWFLGCPRAIGCGRALGEASSGRDESARLAKTAPSRLAQWGESSRFARRREHWIATRRIDGPWYRQVVYLHFEVEQLVFDAWPRILRQRAERLGMGFSYLVQSGRLGGRAWHIYIHTTTNRSQGHGGASKGTGALRRWADIERTLSLQHPVRGRGHSAVHEK